MTGEQTPSQYPEVAIIYATPAAAAAIVAHMMRQYGFAPPANCGCLPDLGGETYLRECDECGNVWRSAMCRHGQPACPRCAAITE